MFLVLQSSSPLDYREFEMIIVLKMVSNNPSKIADKVRSRITDFLNSFRSEYVQVRDAASSTRLLKAEESARRYVSEEFTTLPAYQIERINPLFTAEQYIEIWDKENHGNT